MEAPKPHLDAFSGRFGSVSGGLAGCNSAFRVVTLTLGRDPSNFTEDRDPNLENPNLLK